MSQRIQFPDTAAVIAAESRRYQRLPPADRWRELFALRSFGTRLLESPAQRARIEKPQADEEARWQAIQRDLFERYVR